MRRTYAAVFLLAFSVSAYAQPHERTPKGIEDANRFTDETRARQEFEKAARAMLPANFRASVATYRPSASDLPATWGEFITAGGTQFVALQVALPAGVHPIGKVNFFGVVTANGQEIASYNEAVAPQQSQNDLVVDRTLILPAGKSTGIFGLANGNEIIGMTQVDFEPEPLTKDAAGISRIIASGDVHVLSAAQKPLDPFAFGGTKVEPKPAHAFKHGDEVWLFTEVRNPKLGTDGVPHLNTKVEIDGPKRVPGMMSPAEATPLKGVAGHYGIGNTIDITRLEPGNYVVKVTVMDTVAGQSWKREAALRIVE